MKVIREAEVVKFVVLVVVVEEEKVVLNQEVHQWYCCWKWYWRYVGVGHGKGSKGSFGDCEVDICGCPIIGCCCEGRCGEDNVENGIDCENYIWDGCVDVDLSCRCIRLFIVCDIFKANLAFARVAGCKQPL